MRGIEPITAEVNMSVTLTGRPRWSVPNATGLNRSAAPCLASGQAGWRGLGHVLVPDPQHQAAGVLAVVGFGPHAADLAAQPGGELVAAVHDLGDGDAVGQVQVSAPAGAVAGDRGLELDRARGGSWRWPG